MTATIPTTPPLIYADLEDRLNAALDRIAALETQVQALHDLNAERASEIVVDRLVALESVEVRRPGADPSIRLVASDTLAEVRVGGHGAHLLLTAEDNCAGVMGWADEDVEGFDLATTVDRRARGYLTVHGDDGKTRVDICDAVEINPHGTERVRLDVVDDHAVVEVATGERKAMLYADKNMGMVEGPYAEVSIERGGKQDAALITGDHDDGGPILYFPGSDDDDGSVWLNSRGLHGAEIHR